MRKRILLIGGSLNQTTMAHRIGVHLESDFDVFYSPLFADGVIGFLADRGFLDFTTLAGRARPQAEEYIRSNGLRMDYRGALQDYDLVVSSTDLVVPRNVRRTRFVLVQEGMTDPESWRYHLAKRLGLPRIVASTAMNGLSHAYDAFCVASDGYRDLFIHKGIEPGRIQVTGVPNFDDAASWMENDWPHRGHVLVATSCMRETLRFENRRALIRRACRLSEGRELIFKLHPYEDHRRAEREIRAIAPQATVYMEGVTNHMIANCSALVTRYSSVVFIAAALEKEVHSDLDPETLHRLTPRQNGGTSGRRIAEICATLAERRR
ncbi:MAG: hypothetical protein GEU90_09255 [Gemmatimonas sp.]|nr:hypothetical protein [Gemmatimonas sp.]